MCRYVLLGLKSVCSVICVCALIYQGSISYPRCQDIQLICHCCFSSFSLNQSSCLFLKMAKDFLIIGDSNVQRFYTRLGQLAQGMDFIRARNTDEMAQAFTTFKAAKSTYKIIVLAFITNLIVAAGDDGVSPTERLSAIEGLFNEIVPVMK